MARKSHKAPSFIYAGLAGATLLLLSACAHQVPDAVSHAPTAPGFWWGVWHGFIFPWAWIGSLFDPRGR